jgi:hypothetical protein
MRFPHPRRTEQNDIGSFMHKAQGAQFADLALVDRRLKAEVELLECFYVGQMRWLQPCLEIALASHIGFGGVSNRCTATDSACLRCGCSQSFRIV